MSEIRVKYDVVPLICGGLIVRSVSKRLQWGPVTFVRQTFRLSGSRSTFLLYT